MNPSLIGEDSIGHRSTLPQQLTVLHLPRVIRPVQQGLALAWPAGQVAGAAVGLDLGEVAADGVPAFDLAVVVEAAAAEVVAAVPLEPAARVLGVDPALLPPDRQRLRGVD